MGACCGLNKHQIAEMLDLDVRQVRKALDTDPPTPKKSTSRPPVLDVEQRQQLVDFVCSSKAARKITYHELAQEFCYWNCRWIVVKNALKREGFHPRTAMCKPPILKKNRKLRLKFAIKHKG